MSDAGGIDEDPFESIDREEENHHNNIIKQQSHQDEAAEEDEQHVEEQNEQDYEQDEEHAQTEDEEIVSEVEAAKEEVPSSAIVVNPIDSASRDDDCLDVFSPSMTGRFTVHDVTPTASSTRDTPLASPQGRVAYAFSRDNYSGANSGAASARTSNSATTSGVYDDATSDHLSISLTPFGHTANTADLTSISTSARSDSNELERTGRSLPTNLPSNQKTEINTIQNNLAATAPIERTQTSESEVDEDDTESVNDYADDDDDHEHDNDPYDTVDPSSSARVTVGGVTSPPLSPSFNSFLALRLSGAGGESSDANDAIGASLTSPLETTAIFTPSESIQRDGIQVTNAATTTTTMTTTSSPPPTSSSSSSSPSSTTVISSAATSCETTNQSTPIKSSTPTETAAATTSSSSSSSSSPCCAICSDSSGRLLVGARGLFFHAACLAPTSIITPTVDSTSTTLATTTHTTADTTVDTIQPSLNDRLLASTRNKLDAMRLQQAHAQQCLRETQIELQREIDKRLMAEAYTALRIEQGEEEYEAANASDTRLVCDSSSFDSTSSSIPPPPSNVAHPYTAPLVGLSTAPLITPDVPLPHAYPAPSACHSFPLLVPLAPTGTEPHGCIVFAKEYPSQSLTGRLKPDPPIGSSFTRNAAGVTANYVPPPVWGSEVYRPKCAGDTCDLTSRYLEEEYDVGAESSDWWHEADTKPERHELLYESTTGERPTSTPHHPYQNARNIGNTNYPLSHPQPSSSPLTDIRAASLTNATTPAAPSWNAGRWLRHS